MRVGWGAARPRTRSRTGTYRAVIVKQQPCISRRRLIAQGAAYLVHPRPKRPPPRAPDDEIRQLIRFSADVELEKRVRDGVIEGHVHGLERLNENASTTHATVGESPDRDDLGIAHHGVCQREGQDDLDLERRDVAVRGDVVHGVQQPEVAVRGFYIGGRAAG